MSDFTSNFWSVYVAGLTLIGIIACMLLLWITARKKVVSTSDNTTGHVWDEDLTEMNNPMPRWWMWLFIFTIVFAAIYLALYPGLGTNPGSFNWSSQGQWQAEQADSATVQAVRGRFSFDTLPPIAAKGKAEPVPVYRPRALTQKAARSRAAMIGRGAELARLVEHLRALLARGGLTTVVLEGEAGIGKSLLVDELCRRGQELGVSPLLGGADAIEQTTPYHPWRRLGRQLPLSPRPDEDPAALLAALRRCLPDEPELEAQLPLLNGLLTLRLPETELTDAMPEPVRVERTHELLRIRLNCFGGGGVGTGGMDDPRNVLGASERQCRATAHRVARKQGIIKFAGILLDRKRTHPVDLKHERHRLAESVTLAAQIVRRAGARGGMPTHAELEQTLAE